MDASGVSSFDGSVGIGTTSPGYKLDVKNTANTQTSMDSLTFRALSENYAGTVAVFENTSGLNTSIRISDTVDDMYVVSRNGIMGLGPSAGWSSNNLNITANGDVGIGNRNPSAKLHVKNGDVRIESGGLAFYEGAIYRGGINSRSGTFNIEGKSNIRFNVNNSLVGRWNSSGYFGIGTQDPDFPLDINMSGAKARIWATNGSPSLELRGVNGQILFKNASGGTDFLMINRGNSFAFKQTSQDYIFIQTSGTSQGNIGIGDGFHEDNLPSEKLQVAGNVKATNFILSSDASLKEDVKDLNVKVGAKWKSYKFKDEDEVRYGIIAQELEETNPELVKTDDKGLKSVKYIDLLVAKIAELEARLDKAGL